MSNRSYKILGMQVSRYALPLLNTALSLYGEVTGSSVGCLSPAQERERVLFLACRMEDWTPSISCGRRFDDAVWAMCRAAVDLWLERYPPDGDNKPCVGVHHVRRMIAEGVAGDG